MPTSQFSVQMTCGNCVQGVKDAVQDALGDKVQKVDCNLDTKVVTVDHTSSAADVLAALKEWAEEVEHEVCSAKCVVQKKTPKIFRKRREKIQ